MRVVNRVHPVYGGDVRATTTFSARIGPKSAMLPVMADTTVQESAQATESHRPWRVPDFAADTAILTQYENSKRKYQADRIQAAQRGVEIEANKRRHRIAGAIKQAADLVTERQQRVKAATEEYAKRCPQRVKGNVVTGPSFMENLFSLWAAGRAFQALKKARLAYGDAVSHHRRAMNQEEIIARWVEKVLPQTLQTVREYVGSEKWIEEEFHKHPEIAQLLERKKAIEEERASYASRLEKGLVPPGEARDREMFARGVKPLPQVCTGLVIVELLDLAGHGYFILRDLDKNLYWLPYASGIEPLIDSVFDMYRIVDRYEAKMTKAESGAPMKSIDHYIHCVGEPEAARAQWRKRCLALRADRTFKDTPVEDETMRRIIEVLTQFAGSAAA